jgi:hypothetical protein
MLDTEIAEDMMKYLGFNPNLIWFFISKIRLSLLEYTLERLFLHIMLSFN